MVQLLDEMLIEVAKGRYQKPDQELTVFFPLKGEKAEGELMIAGIAPNGGIQYSAFQQRISLRLSRWFRFWWFLRLFQRLRRVFARYYRTVQVAESKGFLNSSFLGGFQKADAKKAKKCACRKAR